MCLPSPRWLLKAPVTTSSTSYRPQAAGEMRSVGKTDPPYVSYARLAKKLSHTACGFPDLPVEKMLVLTLLRLTCKEVKLIQRPQVHRSAVCLKQNLPQPHCSIDLEREPTCNYFNALIW